MEWYLVIDGVRRGPMSKASVQALIAKGVVKASTPARRPDMAEWFPIGYIKEFNMQGSAQAGAAEPAAMMPAPATLSSPSPTPHNDLPLAQELVTPATTPADPQAPARRFLGDGYLGRHWRGDYSLAVSGWLSGLLLGVAAGVLGGWSMMWMLDRSITSDDPRPLLAGVGLLALLMLLLGVWQMTGVARAALRHKRETGQKLWPNLALAAVLLTAVASLLMICSVLPAVPRAVSTVFQREGNAHRVVVSADGNTLEVSGWLGWGIAGEVHGVLSQHPQIRTVMLDSDAGQ